MGDLTLRETSALSSKPENHVVNEKGKFQNFKHPLVRLIWTSSRWDVLFGTLLSPVHAACEVTLGFAAGALLQLVFASGSETSATRLLPKPILALVPDPSRLTREQLMTLVPLMLIVVGFLRLLTSFGSNYLLERAGHRVAHALRASFLNSYLRASGRILDTRNPDELTSRILLDTTLMQGLVSKGTIGAMRDGLVVISSGLAMLYIASQFFALLLLVFIPFFFALRAVSKRLEFYTRESARRQVEIATRGIQMRNGLLAIYGMGAQSREVQDLQNASQGYYQFIRKTFFLRTGFRPGMEILAIAILAGALQWRLSLPSEIDFAANSTVFVLAALSFRPLKNVSSFISQFAELKAVWRRLEHEWDVTHAVVREKASLQSADVLRATYAMQLKNVSYDALNGQRILHHCTLDIREGRRVALIGESGAGKSTLLRLMAGLLPASEGVVLGVSQVVLATQSPYVFQGTIFENIVYPNSPLNNSEIQRARERAIDLLLSLMLAHTQAGAELLLNKKVGFMGEGLSGGERARVALARLLFADRPVLLLDEPTANLDAASAAAFWSAVWRWQKQAGRTRTVVAVTHDLKDLHVFDDCSVFSEGRLVLSGSPEDVLVKMGNQDTSAVDFTFPPMRPS